MKIFIMILIGLAGGIIGGMGMGGGTLLIPLITMFGIADQHIAQSVNLIAFIPMSALALCVHIHNKLVDFKYLLNTSLPAVATAVLASLIAGRVQSDKLKIYFGIFLIVLGIYQLVTAVSTLIRHHKEKKLSGQRNER